MWDIVLYEFLLKKFIFKIEERSKFTPSRQITQYLTPVYISDVQWEQRVALMEMVEKQNGHSFVVGSSGSVSSLRFNWLIPRINRNTQKATMIKLIIVLIKIP